MRVRKTFRTRTKSFGLSEKNAVDNLREMRKQILTFVFTLLAFGGCRHQQSASESYGFASGNAPHLEAELHAFHAWLLAQHFKTAASPKEIHPGLQPAFDSVHPSFWYRGTFGDSSPFLVHMYGNRQSPAFGFYITATAPTPTELEKLQAQLRPFLQAAQKFHAHYEK